MKCKRLEDRIAWVARQCKNKDVLDVGCVGSGNPQHDDWLHKAICKVAKSVVGIDIDGAQVERLRELGYDIVCANAETFRLNLQVDVITACEFMEHPNNVGMFLDCTRENLRDDGQLVITVPNIRHPYYFFVNGGHVDHVYAYLPVMLKNILKRHDFRVKSIQYFSHPETRWFGKLYERLVVPLFPQLSHNFGVIAEKEGPS